MYRLDPLPSVKIGVDFTEGKGGGSVHRLLEFRNHSVESRIQDCFHYHNVSLTHKPKRDPC